MGAAGRRSAAVRRLFGHGIGRLKPGDGGTAEADLRARISRSDTRDKDRVVTPFVKPLHETFVRDYRTAASTVTASVGILLLIACANVAAVMLARALARRREMGIRLALGSSRMRLLRQLLIENLMLAAAGGVVGLVAGRWAIGALVALIPDELPRWAAFHMDLRVIAFSVAVVVATVVLLGGLPPCTPSEIAIAVPRRPTARPAPRDVARQVPGRRRVALAASSSLRHAPLEGVRSRPPRRSARSDHVLVA